jgi:hypothetical protein
MSAFFGFFHVIKRATRFTGAGKTVISFHCRSGQKAGHFSVLAMFGYSSKHGFAAVARKFCDAAEMDIFQYENNRYPCPAA